VAPSLAQSPQDRLAVWFNRAYPEVLALSKTVFADHDETGGQLMFGVEDAAAIGSVENVLAGLGIPNSVYTIRVTEPIVFAKTLREEFRPTQGGIQIHFSRFLCTLGFNADDGTERSFITNSHCTDKQGVVEGTQYFQPLSFTSPGVIATEVEDPEYFTWRTNTTSFQCPPGRRCRLSDASRAQYSSGVASNRGEIAQTTGPNNGSITVSTTNPTFSITSQDNVTTNFPVGTPLNKVGRTTGWTQGGVLASCVHTNVFGSNYTLLCQTFVGAGVGGGDSGSPVFQITRRKDVKLVGILWGGSGSSLYVFSPLKQIRDELGAFAATAK
jgi:hypothetical protein